MSNRERRGAGGPAWRAEFVPPSPPRTARVRLAVLDPAVAELDSGLEAHLLRTVATWLSDAWPPMRVLLPVRQEAARCRALLQDLGLPAAADGPPDHHSFVLVARGADDLG